MKWARKLLKIKWILWWAGLVSKPDGGSTFEWCMSHYEERMIVLLLPLISLSHLQYVDKQE